MKKFIILLIIPLFTALYANSQTQAAVAAAPAKTEATAKGPVAKWDAIEKDLGEIPKGIPKTADFTLTNDGKEPLFIKSASASCGCTVAKYSQDPIMPGKSTVLSATYNAAAPGEFNKSVTVITNAEPNPVVLHIKGTVK